MQSKVIFALVIKTGSGYFEVKTVTSLQPPPPHGRKEQHDEDEDGDGDGDGERERGGGYLI